MREHRLLLKTCLINIIIHTQYDHNSIVLRYKMAEQLFDMPFFLLNTFTCLSLELFIVKIFQSDYSFSPPLCNINIMIIEHDKL